ncbi:MAG: HIT family protein [Gammaproteobacteria bacterium]|nr:HIT family protein [Gammaproteobacteria bacterium]
METPTPDLVCPFCEILAGNQPSAFVSRLESVSSFVNPRQYRPGATLVIPNRHVVTVFDMTPEEWAAVFVHAKQVAAAACAAIGASGVNIFQNNGRSAGQSVFHVHVHVVPRSDGDKGPAIFGEGYVEKTPMDERRAIAQRIRAHLPRDLTPSAGRTQDSRRARARSSSSDPAVPVVETRRGS